MLNQSLWVPISDGFWANTKERSDVNLRYRALT